MTQRRPGCDRARRQEPANRPLRIEFFFSLTTREIHHGPQFTYSFPMASSEDSERHEQITIKTIRQALLFWPVSPDYTLRPSLQPGRSWSGSVAVGMSACSNEVPPSAMTRPQGWTCGCMLHADPLGSQTLVLDDGLRGWRVVRAAAAVGTWYMPPSPAAHMLAACSTSRTSRAPSNRPQPW